MGGYIMKSRMKSKTLKSLVSLLLMFVVITISSGMVYASEYYNLSGLSDNASFVLGKTVEFTITPKKYVASKWSSWSNYPDYIYVQIYKGSETEPCKSSTFIYNIDGKSVGSVSNFMMPKAVGVARTVSYTPDAVGTYTVKILWQNYDDKDAKKDPALQEQLKFTVTSASGSSGSAAAANEVVDLPAIKIKKIQASKKSATVRWNKLSSKNIKKIGGFEIQYSLDKTFCVGVKTKTVKKNLLLKKITKLKSKKKYYFRIRTYKKIKGVKHVSKWSKVKKVKVK